MTCEHDNPHHQAFYWQCGARLAHRTCSHHHINPADAVFCGTCGEHIQQRHTAQQNDPAVVHFDLRQMLHDAEHDSHQAIASKEVVSQDDIRKLLEKRRHKP